jgi:hypothetical protein
VEGSERVELLAGRIDLPVLAEALARDGRAWVLARDGSVMNVRNSRMELLGYDRAERYGVSWRTRATSGAIDRSVFTGNFHGAYMHGIAAMAVTGSVIEKSHRYGLDPHSGSRNLHIEGNIFRHNGTHGMILAVGCSNATVRGNQSYANAGHGVVVFEGSNDGLRVATGASAVTAARNLIDFNHRAGVVVAEGTARIGPANRLLDNEMGVWLSSDAAGTAVLDNSIEANVLDGVHLAGLRVGQVRGNTIRANRKAAFSVATRGAAGLFLAANRFAGNPEKERVRVEGRPQPTG